MGFLFGGGAGSQESRLSAIKVQEIGYGNVRVIVYGTTRITPILAWTDGFFAIKRKGGKGGKSGGSSYIYFADIIMLACEGPVLGFGITWRDKEVYGDLSKQFSFTRLGTYDQVALPYIVGKYPAAADNYRGIAYVADDLHALRSSGTLGTVGLEVKGRCLSAVSTDQNGRDAFIRDIIRDFIGNEHYGAVSAESFAFDFDDAAMHDYCVARNIVISPALAAQKPAADWLSEWLLVANAAMVWSEGKLKLLPFADEAYANSFGSYTPDTAIRKHFDGGNTRTLIRPVRKNPADCFNSLKVDCLERIHYKLHSLEAKDDTAIRKDGHRPAPKLDLRCIIDPRIASIVAHTELDKSLYIRNSYEIECFCEGGNDLLEPMDFVTISEAALGLDHLRCRVVAVEDAMLTGDDQPNLRITVEAAALGVYSA